MRRICCLVAVGMLLSAPGCTGIRKHLPRVTARTAESEHVPAAALASADPAAPQRVGTEPPAAADAEQLDVVPSARLQLTGFQTAAESVSAPEPPVELSDGTPAPGVSPAPDAAAAAEADPAAAVATDPGLSPSGQSAAEQLTPAPTTPEIAAPADVPAAPGTILQFDDVVNSVYRSYPMLQAALYNRNIASGQQLGASGAFDLKFKGASENGPQGFYQTYRHNIGVVQPTYWGGEVFAGYRLGRGDYQPWYLERQTNDGGEFKAGVQVPLARNREIDERRAALWKAGYGRSLAEPEIQAELIGFVRESSYAYWDWVAAGEYNRIARRLLALAEDRTSRIEAQVKAGLVDPPELTDNLRLVSIRQAKVSDTRRKLEQTAAKLSVYWRDESGQPQVAVVDQLPGFPEPEQVPDSLSESDIQLALAQRPELRALDLIRRQVQVDYTEAVNQLQPELNAVVWGSQDVGEPTSSKRDKSEFESEAAIYLDVPMQRRKARGKMQETQGKLAQLSAKRRITADKIRIDLQTAHAALKSAWEQVLMTREALEQAEELAVRERTNQELGISDLLKVTLREQYAFESAEKNVDALKLYFESRADYRAAMALDQLNR